MTAELDLVAYLGDRHVKTFRAAGNEITAHCLWCPDGDPKGKGKLYLNTDSWLWECKRCGERGNRRTLLQHFGDEDELTHAAGADPMLRRHILGEAAALAHQMLLGNDTKIEYLLDRGLSPEIIATGQLGYVPRNVGLSEMLPGREGYTYRDLIGAGLVTVAGKEFFNDCLVIPYFSHGTVVQLRSKDVDGKYRTTSGDYVRLYNADALHGADQVLITEGEFDSLAVRTRIADSGDRYLQALAVVGVPGAGSWPENLVGSLDSASKVFIGLDPDDVGIRYAEKLREAIGSKARLVHLPEGEPKTDWTDWFRPKTGRNPHGGNSWRELRDLLIESDLAGKQMFSIVDAAAKWRKRQIDAPGLQLGWKSLDSVLRPGLKAGQVMMPLAKSGCIQGDADMVVNRGGKSFHISLRDLVHMQNGGGRGRGNSKTWDLTIPTRVQRETENEVRLGTIKAAWFSGDKMTYTVTTETGRTIRATNEHPFLTERGWLRLDQLETGDLLHVRGERSNGGRIKINYKLLYGMDHHPYASRVTGKDIWRHPVHRVVAEATQLNGLPFREFEARLRAGEVVGLRFLDPTTHAVHHLDHDAGNNRVDNLQILTHSQHAALHAAEGTTRNVQIQVAYEQVVCVEPYGVEPTYDIEVEDAPHNFIANGFVVHNTGKSVWLSNVAHNLRDRRVLYVSLEMTAAEVFEHVRRIHHFWNPRATFDETMLDYQLLQIVERNRIGRGDLGDLIREYASIVGAPPELVIVDYLQYYARGFRAGSMYERVSDAAMELKAVAKEEEVALICPSQVNRAAEHGKPLSADDARDSGVVDETADFVISLFRPDQLVNREDPTGALPVQTGNFNIGLLKSRHGGKGRVFQMRMSLMSLVIVDAVFDKHSVTRVDQENRLIAQGVHYDEFRQRRNDEVAQRTFAEMR